jgi:putative DNA primase/helicase
VAKTINFAALAEALLGRADTLVRAWLPGGVQRGHEYICGSLQGGKGDSCAVNLTNGRWADFSTDDKGGDLVSLYAAVFGFARNEMGKAAVQLARDEGLEDIAGVTPERSSDAPARARPEPVAAAPTPAPYRAEPEGWKTMMPVPDHAPAATFKHQFRNAQDIEHTATYQLDGQLLGYVVRFKTSEGGKETLPYTWCTSARDGASRWHWKQWDEPRPLYIPGQTMPGNRTVVLVEGEKKAGILHELLEAAAPGVYLVVSWPGGCKAWKKAMWDWLQGCTVLLWPDCDAKREPLNKAEAAACLDDAGLDMAKAMKPLLPAYKQPGMSAMLGIGAHLMNEHGCTVQLLPIPEPGTVADGWDCADAIATDGWDAARVLAFFGRAQALPGVEADAPAAAGSGGSGGGKKIDGPAEAGDSEDGDRAAATKDLPWWLAPYWDADKCRWLTSRKMVIAVLRNDPNLKNVLGMNQLSNNIDARTAWPWPYGKPGPITGAVDLLLGNYITETYGCSSIARAALTEAIETVAHGRPFHPFREFLAGLQHDGKSRIDKWLVHALGETPESLTPPMFEYLTQVGRFWLLAMVNRVMQPGCKFDYCPVLEGPGGYMKSTLVEVLAGSEYFSDTHFDVSRGKEGQEQVQGLVMYEIAELANFGKAEIGLIKAFITAKVDRYRPSYGRVVESFARQCVLVGTTNENTYLRDRTGNRRFWPIPVRNRINIAWVQKYREQLFAEAYALYLADTAFTPSHQDEARLFVPVQESRLVETAVLSELRHVLTRPETVLGPASLVNRMTEFVTISQLTMALGVDAAKSTPGLEAQIRSWLDHERWERAKKQLNGARAWGYVRPAQWPPAEAEEPPAPPPLKTLSKALAGPEEALSVAAQFNQDADDVPF